MHARLPVALICASLAAGVSAQDPPKPTFRADANYVRVDMFATQDGRPVEDLRQDEIELLEDGVRQNVVAFEHVHVRPAGPQDSRVEPDNVRDSRAMAADPRARVFVIFLDTYHTQLEGSQNMRLPLARFLDRVIGQDDLVAVMTPEMSAANLAFGRKTSIISAMMQKQWTWGRRDQPADKDPKEARYEGCFPPNDSDPNDIAREMIARRREKLTLDALEDLVIYLGGLREERKAVLTVSEGWMLFGENPKLARVTGNRVPGRPRILVGPDGKIQQNDAREPAGVSDSECDADRTALANLDHRFRLMHLTEDANRANVTFYPIFPRGLAAGDAPFGLTAQPPPRSDMANLQTRQDSLRSLALDTDGLSVVNTNDIEGGMRRIVEDLTSYYLLGYYSSNGKLDGKFRSISVRVTRPGVGVRARRGYRGRTAADLTKAVPDGGTGPALSPGMSAAMAGVAAAGSRSLVRIRAAVWPAAAALAGSSPGETAAALWLVGELDASLRKQTAWTSGGTADLVIVSAAGGTVATRTIDLDSASSTFTARLPETGGLVSGEYAVRLQVRPKNGGLPVSEVARVIVPGQAAAIGEAVLWRRGPFTGPRFVTTADPRFQRSERIKLEHATTAAGPATARMLDRTGKPMQVPVTVSERRDDSGEFRWLMAEAVLAPLAAGDYAIEISLDDAKVLTGFKVVP